MANAVLIVLFANAIAATFLPRLAINFLSHSSFSVRLALFITFETTASAP